MMYCKTNMVEQIAVHPLDDIESTHFVELVRHGDVPILSVWLDDGEEEWEWEFEMFVPADYERIKMNIYDAIFACDTMLELAEALDDIFDDRFADILIVDECSDCDGCCGDCNKSKR